MSRPTHTPPYRQFNLVLVCLRLTGAAPLSSWGLIWWFSTGDINCNIRLHAEDVSKQNRYIKTSYGDIKISYASSYYNTRITQRITQGPLKISYGPSTYHMAPQNMILPLQISYCPSKYYVTPQNILWSFKISYGLWKCHTAPKSKLIFLLHMLCVEKKFNKRIMQMCINSQINMWILYVAGCSSIPEITSDIVRHEKQFPSRLWISNAANAEIPRSK